MKKLDILLICCLVFLSFIIMTNASPVQRGFAAEGGDFGPVRSKKPFCNAFTGCGRKRSDPEMAEEELMNLLVQRIQGIRDQEVGYSNAGVVKRQNFEDYILN